MLRAASLNQNVASYLSVSNPKGARRLFISGLIIALLIVILYGILSLAGVPAGVAFDFRGIPVGVSLLTLLMCVLFWVDGNHYIQTHQNNLSMYHYSIASSIVMVTVVLSIALHELSHGVTSELLGNPIDHAGISWWGAFVAPSNGLSEMHPLEEFLVAIAGPTTNVLIALLAAYVVIRRNESLFENSIQYVSVINMKLWRFNMIPLLFLDGGKAVDGLLRLGFSNIWIRLILQTIIWLLTIRLYKRWRKNHTSFEDKLATL